MKKMILAVMFLLGASVQAHAVDFDGCYQLLVTGTLYPTLCVQGTNEEGIGGGGARMAIFTPGTNSLQQCLKATSLVINNQTFKFQVNNRDVLTLQNFQFNGGTFSGDAIIGAIAPSRPANVNFIKLSSSISAGIAAITAAQCH